MPDLGTISTVITSIKTATEIAKLIKDSGTSLENAETKLRLAELISALADAKIEIAGIQELIAEKDKTISDLLSIKGSVKYDAPYYWLEQEDGRKDGPYCQQCYDNDKKLIRLQVQGQRGRWRCKTCDNSYEDSSYKAQGISVKSF